MGNNSPGGTQALMDISLAAWMAFDFYSKFITSGERFEDFTQSRGNYRDFIFVLVSTGIVALNVFGWGGAFVLANVIFEVGRAVRGLYSFAYLKEEFPVYMEGRFP